MTGEMGSECKNQVVCALVSWGFVIGFAVVGIGFLVYIVREVRQQKKNEYKRLHRHDD